MATKKKYRILWNRVIIAAIVLLAVIIGICMLIGSLIGAIKNAFSKDDSSSAAKANASVVQSSDIEGSSEESDEDFSGIIVIIDAGHGGDDVGALDPTETRYEKNDTLRIALQVAQYLGQHEDVKVIMTRSEDVFVSLDDRCSIANDANADLFVSLHRNLYDGEAQGVEIWVNNQKPATDTALAQNILNALKGVGISNDRGVNYGYIGNPYVNYQVNRETNMPSCLVELGFMQDADDNRLFDENLDSYAKAISDAIYKTAQENGMIDDTDNTSSSDDSSESPTDDLPDAAE